MERMDSGGRIDGKEQYVSVEDISFFGLLGLTFDFKLETDDFRLLLFLLFLLIITSRLFFFLVKELLYVDHLAQSQSDLVAQSLALFATSFDCCLFRVDFLHEENGTLRGSHSKPLRVRSGYLRKESIR